MLEFYCDFLLHYIGRKKFQCVQIEADSLYKTFNEGCGVGGKISDSRLSTPIPTYPKFPTPTP